MKDTKTPIDTGLVARISGAWKAITNKQDSDAWFGPAQAPAAVVTGEQVGGVLGRAMDYTTGQNIRTQPRAGEPVTFAQMRALADSLDILRLVIETRKDQLAKYQFNIQREDGEVDKRCEEIKAFFKNPDGENTWNTWLRMLLEEMMVTDAVTVYPWLTNGGTPYRFELMDGTTIKRVIDARGRTPAPPNTAYQQILKGVPACDYSVGELVYAPRNKRVHKIYGYSPVEQIIMTVNIALRRSLHQLQYYTEGSTPDLLFQVPETWNMTQIKEFNDWWQDCLAGNTAQRRKAQFVPHGVTPINTKEGLLKDDFDEWLARIVCYAFNVPPTPFVKQQNRATADNASEQAILEGLEPIKLWVKDIIDLLIIKYFGDRNIEFKWRDLDSIDPKTQSEIDDRNVKNGSKTLNEVRASRGDKPIEGGDMPMVLTASGYVPITPIVAEDTVDGEGDNTPPDDDGDKDKGDKKETEDADDKEGPKQVDKISKSLAVIEPIVRDRADYESTITKVVFDYLADKKAQVLDNVVNKLAKKDVAEYMNALDWDSWEDFADLMGEQLAAVAVNGAKEAFLQINFDADGAFTLANEGAIAYAKARGAELVGMKVDNNGDIVNNPDASYNIEESTREMLRVDITTAMVEGWSNDKLASVLGANYGFSALRAETIARTETAKADTAGNMVAYRASGVVEKKRWIVGAECCDECTELNGEIVALDKPFSDGSDAPPAHPNCRCDFVPIMNETEVDNE